MRFLKSVTPWHFLLKSGEQLSPGTFLPFFTIGLQLLRKITIWCHRKGNTSVSSKTVSCYKTVVYMEIPTHLLSMRMSSTKVQKQPPEVLCKKKCSYKIRKIHCKTPVPESLNFIKKETLRRCFPMNFAKFLKTPFLHNISGRLLLKVHCIIIKNCLL